MMTIGGINLDDSVALINLAKKGLRFKLFQEIADSTSITIKEWSKFLHITERTIQRYKKEKKNFEPIHSERILEIAKVHKKGIAVFESKENFNIWLHSNIIALGGIKPIEILDSLFGIDLILDELGRIEHGILAWLSSDLQAVC